MQKSKLSVIIYIGNIFYIFRRIKMSEVIVITSGKGGVGKTTTSANLGTGLAMQGKKVAMIDADIWSS